MIVNHVIIHTIKKCMTTLPYESKLKKGLGSTIYLRPLYMNFVLTSCCKSLII